MATSYQDRAGRQKILEGLWMIGIPPEMISVSVDLDGEAFLRQLHDRGVDDHFIGRAITGVDWRAGDTSLSQNIMGLLRASGYRTDEVQRFYDDVVQRGAANDPHQLLAGLTTLFGDRTAGAMMIKATGGKPPDGTAWNPYRTDAPPRNVDTRYGGGGIAAANLPAGMTTTEAPNPTAYEGQRVRPNQTAGVPTPPPSVRPNQLPTPGAPSLSGRTGGPGGPGAGGPGGGGPGGTPAPRPLTPAEIRSKISADYGWAAALADIPEIAKILNDAASGLISEDEANNRWLASNYYKQTTVNERNWNILAKTNEGEARAQIEAQVTSIMQNADRLGVQMDPARARQIAETSKKHGWSDQQINAAIASEIHYDPAGAKTGVLAQIKAAQNAQLVPLSDQAMTQWAQAIVSGTKTQADFEAYLKDQAKSLFPALATALDDPHVGSVRQYLDPYGQQIEKTLGLNSGDIDWTDPKWFRFINQVDPKTGQRGIVPLADVSRTLMADPQYNYDQTTNGKTQKTGLARTILQQWGFVSGSGQGQEGF